MQNSHSSPLLQQQLATFRVTVLDLLLVTVGTNAASRSIFRFFVVFFLRSGLLQPSELARQRLGAQPDGHQAGQHAALQLRPGLPAHRPEQRHVHQDAAGDPPVERSGAALPR